MELPSPLGISMTHRHPDNRKKGPILPQLWAVECICVLMAEVVCAVLWNFPVKTDLIPPLWLRELPEAGHEARIWLICYTIEYMVNGLVP